MLKRIGVYPLRDHYYEPLFNDAHLSVDLAQPRKLPGIDFRLAEQIAFLNTLRFQDEFEAFLRGETTSELSRSFFLGNGSFEAGDAEFLFNFLRAIKPRRVIEIGCGSSTKIIAHALARNADETGEPGLHICIEPYEQPWLEGHSEITLIRSKLEDVEPSLFASLGEGDLLFIDSSHVIRPQGDVLREFLEIIPALNRGVHVHVHDIFSPADYPDDWVRTKVRLWNEQYLLEATLSSNPSYRIVAALNYLKHNCFAELKAVCPHLAPQSEPGSFYFVRQ